MYFATTMRRDRLIRKNQYTIGDNRNTSDRENEKTERKYTIGETGT